MVLAKLTASVRAERLGRLPEVNVDEILEQSVVHRQPPAFSVKNF
jgi:hypothetical protein